MNETSELTTTHIFLVEDDESLASLVEDYLVLQGFKVSVEGRGDLATERILAEAPDIVILDIMLPGKNGLDICRELRTTSQIPIIMLTARSDDIDQIVGLEVGADDYVPKPAQPRLLLARINALLRRAQSESAVAIEEKSQDLLSFDDLSIQVSKQEVMWQGELVELTTNEFDLFLSWNW